HGPAGNEGSDLQVGGNAPAPVAPAGPGGNTETPGNRFESLAAERPVGDTSHGVGLEGSNPVYVKVYFFLPLPFFEEGTSL
ncbi:hypothetical protein LZ189_16885, partial [Rhodovulum sulfidophilum]|nr:hypothetical protein [Rhodovulum sulfidophilum]